MSTVYQTNSTQFGLFDSHGFVFGNNNGGPCLPGWTLLGSQVWLLQVILADAPFVAIGLLGFALGTFFVIGGQIQRSIFYITASILLAFFAAVFDLSQTLIGNTTNRMISGLVIAQQFFLTFSTLARFLFFYRFVFEPPPGEVPIASTGSGARANARATTMHSASWERFGVFGRISKWVLLLAVVNIAVLEGIWRVGFLFSIPKFKAIYFGDQILQLVVSAFIWVKLGLNVLEASKLGRPKWETVGLYTAPVLGLVIGASVAAGSLIIFLFSETPVGRFLQAMEMYVLAVYVLTMYHRYHRPDSASFIAFGNRSDTPDSVLDITRQPAASDRKVVRPSFVGLGLDPRLSTFRLSPPQVSEPDTDEVHEAARNLQRQSYVESRVMLNESRMSRASRRASEAFANWSNYMRSATPGGGDRTPALRRTGERDDDRLWEKGQTATLPGSSENGLPSSGPTTGGLDPGSRSNWLQNRDAETGMGIAMGQDPDDQQTGKPPMPSAYPTVSRGPSPYSRGPSPFINPPRIPRTTAAPPPRPYRPASVVPFEVRAPGAPMTPDIDEAASRPRNDVRTSSELVPTIASLAAAIRSNVNLNLSQSDLSSSPHDNKSYVNRPGSAFTRSGRSTAPSSGTSEFSLDVYTTNFPVPPRRIESQYAQQGDMRDGDQVGIAFGGEEVGSDFEGDGAGLDQASFDFQPPRMPAARADLLARTTSFGSSTGAESRNEMEADFDVTSFIAGARDTLDAHPGSFSSVLPPNRPSIDSPSGSLFSMPASPHQAQIMQAEFVTRRPSQSRRASRILSEAPSSVYASTPGRNSAATVAFPLPPSTSAFPLPPSTLNNTATAGGSPKKTVVVGLSSNPRSATPSTAPSSPVEDETGESSAPTTGSTIQGVAPTSGFTMLPTPTSLYRNPAKPIRFGSPEGGKAISNPVREASLGPSAVWERPRPAPIATGLMARKR